MYSICTLSMLTMSTALLGVKGGKREREVGLETILLGGPWVGWKDRYVYSVSSIH